LEESLMPQETPERTQPPSRPPTPDEVRQRIQEAIQSTRDAVQQQGDEAATPSPTPGPNVTITRVPFDPNNFDIPPRVTMLGTFFFITIFAIIVFLPIARAIGRWIDRRAQVPARPSAEVTSQLTQLTQSVDAIAIEVERISEGQRFTTKLLSDLQARRGSMLPAETVGSRAAE
jgi:hypothetical protein